MRNNICLTVLLFLTVHINCAAQEYRNYAGAGITNSTGMSKKIGYNLGWYVNAMSEGFINNKFAGQYRVSYMHARSMSLNDLYKVNVHTIDLSVRLKYYTTEAIHIAAGGSVSRVFPGKIYDSELKEELPGVKAALLAEVGYLYNRFDFVAQYDYTVTDLYPFSGSFQVGVNYLFIKE